MSALPDWTLREAYLFDCTMRLGSLTAAAAHLQMGQSAASKQLAALETKLGYVLFERSGRQLLPTEAAYRFHAHVRDVIDVVGQTPEAKDLPRELTVAVPPTFAGGFIQAATHRFLTANPNVRVSIEVRNTPVIEELVSEGRVELGISDGSIGNPTVRAVKFHRSSLAVFLPLGHPLVEKSRISGNDLAGQTIVHLTRRHPSRTHMERVLSTLSPSPNAVVEASTASSAIYMARELNAVTYSSAFPMASFLPEGMVMRSFDNSTEFVSRFLLATWQSPSLQTKTLMTSVRRYVEQLQENVCEEPQFP